ncbi:MAG TPA: prepilin-type N-terminal cleavage/methylation domain-containing protein [Terriglobales bacterium]
MRNTFGSKVNRRQQGFTLIEVLVSMVVLTIGLVSLLGVFVMAMAKTQSTQQDMIAKQVAQEAYEALFTARETANVSWAQIQNVGTGNVPDGIFTTGMQSVRQAGNDGIIGTADDSGASPQSMTLPGPDGIVGTSDDINMPLTNFRRSITITPVVTGGVISSDLRNVNITVQYYTTQSKYPKTYSLSGFISQYR